MRQIIIFLIRKKLGLKKYEDFRFSNQKSEALYFFTDDSLMKKLHYGRNVESNVSLNWILNNQCAIIKGGNR